MNFATAATDNPEARRLEKDIKAWLEARGHVVRGADAQWVGSPDFVIVLGGDGFILEQSNLWSSIIRAYSFHAGAPMVRVNFGRRGFLANVEPDDVYNKLNLLFEKKYIIQHRDRISVYAPRTYKDEGDSKVYEIGNGLNDIVLERTNPRTILFKVECGITKHEYMSDGVIFSTRTGSSGYNRSAGGPITEKNGFIIVNPICPIDQAQWWMVHVDAPEITVSPSIGKARLVIDGREKAKIAPGQEVYIKLHGYSRFVEFGDE